jgi:hypothetical protein
LRSAFDDISMDARQKTRVRAEHASNQERRRLLDDVTTARSVADTRLKRIMEIDSVGLLIFDIESESVVNASGVFLRMVGVYPQGSRVRMHDLADDDTATVFVYPSFVYPETWLFLLTATVYILASVKERHEMNVILQPTPLLAHLSQPQFTLLEKTLKGQIEVLIGGNRSKVKPGMTDTMNFKMKDAQGNKLGEKLVDYEIVSEQNENYTLKVRNIRNFS